MTTTPFWVFLQNVRMNKYIKCCVSPSSGKSRDKKLKSWSLEGFCDITGNSGCIADWRTLPLLFPGYTSFSSAWWDVCGWSASTASSFPVLSSPHSCLQGTCFSEPWLLSASCWETGIGRRVVCWKLQGGFNKLQIPNIRNRKSMKECQMLCVCEMEYTI